MDKVKGLASVEEQHMPDSGLVRRLQGWRLVTAEITYRLPDHPSLLQEFIRQELDLLPELPELRKFLEFWKTNIEGPIHSVRVSCAQLMAPVELRCAAGLWRLH